MYFRLNVKILNTLEKYFKYYYKYFQEKVFKYKYKILPMHLK